MHDELTAVDMQKMREELREREEVLMPKILEDVKFARSFGDLSENFEYKAAKAEQRKNMSRIRYLKQMLASAVVIDAKSDADVVGLFDRVVLYLEEDGEEMTVRFVTTLRQNALEGLISKESPLGEAVIGHKAGERVYVRVNDDYGYYAEIRSIEKGQDDDSLEIRAYRYLTSVLMQRKERIYVRNSGYYGGRACLALRWGEADRKGRPRQRDPHGIHHSRRAARRI